VQIAIYSNYLQLPITI